MNTKNFEHTAKCMCESCSGTGIRQGFAGKQELGVICANCNGMGYKNVYLNGDSHLDEKTGVISIVNKDNVLVTEKMFCGLNKAEGVKYILVSPRRYFTSTWFFDRAANEINVIRYEDFLYGTITLPKETHEASLKKTN